MINIHTHMHIALMDGQEIKTLLSKFMDLWLFNFVKYALPINAVSKNLWFYAHILLALTGSSSSSGGGGLGGIIAIIDS